MVPSGDVPEAVVEQLRQRLIVARSGADPVTPKRGGPPQPTGAKSESPATRLLKATRALHAATDLSDVMINAAPAAISAVDGADWASIAAAGVDGRVYTVAATSELALRIDQLQYGVGEGPCLIQLSTAGLNTVSAADLTSETRWPGFVPEAVRAGVRSVLCIGLFPDVRFGPVAPLPLASLNLYSAKPGK